MMFIHTDSSPPVKKQDQLKRSVKNCDWLVLLSGHVLYNPENNWRTEAAVERANQFMTTMRWSSNKRTKSFFRYVRSNFFSPNTDARDLCIRRHPIPIRYRCWINYTLYTGFGKILDIANSRQTSWRGKRETITADSVARSMLLNG